MSRWQSLPVAMITALLCAGPVVAAQQQPQSLPPALAESDRVGLQAVSDLQAGRYAQAEPLFLRALALRESVLGPDHPAVVTSLNNLALLYKVQGRYSEAERLFRRGLEASERTQGREHPETLISVSNLANLFLDQGRYADAEPLFRRALEVGQRTRGVDDSATITYLNNLASLYQAQGRPDEAEQLLSRAIDALEQVPDVDNETILSLSTNLASIYRLQERYEEALPLYLGALQASESVLGRDHARSLAILGNLAGLYQDQGRHVEAQPLLLRALEANRRVLGRNHPGSLIATINLAASFEEQNNLAEAKPLFRDALQGSSSSLGLEHPLTLASAEALVRVELGQSSSAAVMEPARLMLNGERLRRREVAARGQQGQAQVRREASSAAARFALFGDAAWAASTSEPAQLTALREEAFGALQRSVAGAADRAIAEQAARRYAAGRNPALAGLIRERARLEGQWSRLDERLVAAFGDTPGAGEQPLALRRALEQVQMRIAEIDEQLRAGAPEYFALVEPDPVSISAARALVDAEEAIVLVMPSRFGTHVMVVTRDSLTWHRSDWTATRVRTAVQRLRWDAGALVDGSEDEVAALRALPEGERPSFDRATAHALYRQLIEPAARALSGKRRLAIAAGGSLAGLPFSILVSSRPEGDDADPAALRTTQWLGDDYDLVHIPSIQALALLRGAPNEGDAGDFFGIGNPVLGPAATQRGRRSTRGAGPGNSVFQVGRADDGALVADPDMLRSFASLPGTAIELDTVRRTLGAPPSALLLADRATEPNVRALDLSNARVLQFATHGLTPAEASGVGEAGLVLTPPREPRDGDDGFLAASEVATLNLAADWVILSACNTATGDGIDNPGLGPLARAFFYAGARNLLASHWPVSDEVAPILITRTLALEQAGTPRAAAFRQAMREIRTGTAERPSPAEWAHPFYWAPFVLIGDGGSRH